MVSIKKTKIVFFEIFGILEFNLQSTGGTTETVSAWYEASVSFVFNYPSNSLLQLTSWVRLRQGLTGLHLDLGHTLVVHEWQGPGEKRFLHFEA